MKRNTIYPFWIFLVFLAITAQTQKPSTRGLRTRAHARISTTDSLEILLETNLTTKDRVQTLLALAKIQRKKAGNKAQKNLTKAIAIAQKNNDNKSLANAYLANAHHLRALKTLNASIHYYCKAYWLYKNQVNVSAKKGEVFFNLARIYHTRQKFDTTLLLFDRAIVWYNKAKKPLLAADSRVRKGRTYYSKGDYLRAIETIQQGISIYRKTGSIAREGRAYNTLGSTYYLMADYPKAIEIYKKSLEININARNKPFIRSNYTNIGLCYIKLKKYDKALHNLLKAEKLSIETNTKSGIASASNGIGNVYLMRKDYDKALAGYRKAVKIAREIKSKYILPFSLNGTARVFIAMQQPDSALRYAKEALEISQETGSKNTIRDAAELLAGIYEKKRKFELAYVFYKKFKQLSDTLLDEAKIKKITSLENKFAYEKEAQKQLIKQAELSGALKQHKILNNAFLVGILLTLLLFFYIFRSYQMKRKAHQILIEKNNMITQQKEEIIVQAEELIATNEQLVDLGNFKESMIGMIVHDLKNPLNVIIGLSEGEEYRPEFMQMIHNSGQNMLNLVMNILDVQKFEASEMKLQPDTHPLQRIVKTAGNDVQLLLQEKGVKISTHLSPDNWVMAEEELVIRVVTNLLTNAIKYSPEDSKIHVMSEEIMKDNRPFVKVWVRDKGIGIPADKLYKVFNRFGQVAQKKSGQTRSTGLGLTFCKLAIEAHQGEIGVESVEGEGTAFWFTLPLSKASVKTSNEVETTEAGDLFCYETEKGSMPDVPVFLPEERTLIAPVLEALSSYEFYEFSKIKTTLAKLDNFENANIQVLKNQLNAAFLAMNENTFQQLINKA